MNGFLSIWTVVKCVSTLRNGLPSTEYHFTATIKTILANRCAPLLCVCECYFLYGLSPVFFFYIVVVQIHNHSTLTCVLCEYSYHSINIMHGNLFMRI